MQYTYDQLKNDVNRNIKGKIGMLIDVHSSLNDGVREVLSDDVDLVAARRRALLASKLFTDQNETASPTDLKGYALINIEPQTNRARRAYVLVPQEEWYRRRDPNTVALNDADGIKRILVNTNQVNDKKIVISTLDSTTAGALSAWQAVGDATNLRADNDNYVRENGSLRFDIGAGATTTAGVKNLALTSFDATDYFGGNGAIFVWVWITSVTNLTNFILQIGSSASAYYQKTVTVQNDNTTFRTGWNLLRFDLTSLATTGVPVLTAFNFVSIFMTKTAGKVNETDYRFDSIVIGKGEIDTVYYYSKYGWQNTSGTYLEESTASSDYLNADTDEYNMILAKCSEIAADEVDEEKVSDKQAKRYASLKKAYKLNHPSEAMIMISTVADFKRT